jgi:2-polyprenyl-3-methyl-5-hydroxy-6-metoxy-1,4-benzoquinol methylase
MNGFRLIRHFREKRRGDWRGNDHQFITALYRTLLSRKPDADGLSTYLDALKRGMTPEKIVGEILASPEFLSRFQAQAPALLSGSPAAVPMAIDLTMTADQSRALWARVAADWSKLGASKPYWSVLLEPQWEAGQMAPVENLDAFYETGREDVARLDNWLARSGLSLRESGTCAEFGCGVGRCTIWLAKRFARVVAFDISEPHLHLAIARAKAAGLTNIEFVHLKTSDDLKKLADIDFFYSIIVLQHNPPPVIASILTHAFEGLRPGGIAFFQVPTYATDYSFDLKDYLRRKSRREVEMHFIPQRSVFDLADAHGLRPVEVSPDGAIGHFGRWISTSFLMTKRA